jgi:hypothetical protein
MLGWALLLAALPLRALAASPDGAGPPLPTAETAPQPQLLDLRLPPPAPPPAIALVGARSDSRTEQGRRRALRLEARKSFIEWGVEGSREALMACQRGAYPGATVAASGVLTAGGEGQPDHCYRF